MLSTKEKWESVAVLKKCSEWCAQNKALPQRPAPASDHCSREPRATCLQLEQRCVGQRPGWKQTCPDLCCGASLCFVHWAFRCSFLPASLLQAAGHTAEEKLGHRGVTTESGELARVGAAIHSLASPGSCSSAWWMCCQSYGSSLIAHTPAAYAE